MKSFSSSRFQSYGFFFAVLLNLQITRTVGGFAPTNEKCSKAIEITEGGDLENQRLSQEYTEAYYKIYLGKPMALKVYGFSSSVTSDYLSMSMRPSVSSDSTGTCDDSAGVPFVKKSEYESISSRLEESKKMLWETGGTNTINGGYFSVGVHAPHLVAKGWWYVHVHFEPKHKNDTVNFSMGAYLGMDACQVPNPSDLHICGDHVTYPTLGVQWRHAERSPGVGSGQSKGCMKALTQAWCYQTFFKCGMDGIGIKPCSSACTDLQDECPKCPTDAYTGEKRCERFENGDGWRQENHDLNSEFCYTWPTKLERDSGLHSNFGPSKMCFTDEHATWGKIGVGCRQLHFACETPECYPTARPLFCNENTGEGNSKSGDL
jgi:hypothetical protein